MAWMGTCGRGGDIWQGMREFGRVWGHVAGVVAECVGMWQGWGHVVGGQDYAMDGDIWQGKGHVVGCGGM